MRPPSLRGVLPLLPVLAVLAAAGTLLTRPLLPPTPLPPVAVPVRELPVPPQGRAPAARTRLRADPAASRARITATGAWCRIEAQATRLTAELEWGADRMPAALSFSLDLGSLRSPDGASVMPAAEHLLGVRARDELAFTGVLRSCRSLPGGVMQPEFTGLLTLGGSAWQTTLSFWLAVSPDAAVSLQGIGSLQPGFFPLPRRFLLGVIPERPDVTLALDLHLAGPRDR